MKQTCPVRSFVVTEIVSDNSNIECTQNQCQNVKQNRDWSSITKATNWRLILLWLRLRIDILLRPKVCVRNFNSGVVLHCAVDRRLKSVTCRTFEIRTTWGWIIQRKEAASSVIGIKKQIEFKIRSHNRTFNKVIQGVPRSFGQYLNITKVEKKS